MKNFPKIIIIALILVITVELINFFKVPLIKETVANATTIKPETFTELYFENHTTLPTKSTDGQEYGFTFTIHNLENQDMVYPYSVYYQFDNQQVPILNDIVGISDNSSKSIQTTIPAVDFHPIKVVVELTNKKQDISFWIR
jgi:hypothetical protein